MEVECVKLTYQLTVWRFSFPQVLEWNGLKLSYLLTVWFYRWSGFAVERVKLTYPLTVWLCDFTGGRVVKWNVSSCLICWLCVWFTGDQGLEWNVSSRLACWLSFFKMIRFWSGLCKVASAVNCMSLCADRWSSAWVELPSFFACWLNDCLWFSRWSGFAVERATLTHLLTVWLCVVSRMTRCWGGTVWADLPVDWVWFFRW